jgi:hypothetical protein
MPVRRRPLLRAASAPTDGGRRWLLFVHQLPSKPSNIRVRVWRRLQQIGALVIKQAVYILPDSPDAREDLEWLKEEIEAVGGQASILSAEHIDGTADDELVEEFRRARQEDYAALSRDIENSLGPRRATGTRRGRAGRGAHRPAQALRQRLAAIERIDFFASAGRDRAVVLLEQLASRRSPASRTARSSTVTASKPTYHARLWVTRPRPGVDRMSSAWLIRRFIDPDARFAFVAEREKAPATAVPFDMFGVEFGHHGSNCTFETLREVFGIVDRAVARIAAIVHDLDLKDARFGAAESDTIGALIAGLQLAHPDDHDLLERGTMLFESLYRNFAQTTKKRPRQVARPRTIRKRRSR